MNISVLRELLRHPNPLYRRDALRTIATFDTLELLEDVIHCFELESDATVKAKCSWVLGHFRCKAAFGLLKTCLEDEAEDEEVRIWAAWAVGEIATTSDEGYLRRILERTGSPELRRAIGGAVKKVSLDSVRAPASQVARQLHPPKSGDPRVRAIVDRLQALEADPPNDFRLVVQLRRELKLADDQYFRSYMDWVRRKPVLQRALDDPRAVYRD